MPVIGVTWKRSCANNQAASVRDCNARLHTKLIGLLRTQPPRMLEHRFQSDHSQTLGIRIDHLAALLPHPNPKYRLLALQHPTKTLELLGVRAATSAPPQALSFISERLLQGYSGSLGRFHHLVARDLEQTRAVGNATAFSCTVIRRLPTPTLSTAVFILS